MAVLLAEVAAKAPCMQKTSHKHSSQPPVRPRPRNSLFVFMSIRPLTPASHVKRGLAPPTSTGTIYVICKFMFPED